MQQIRPQSPRTFLRQNSAFTLVELLAVMGIMAILAGLIVPAVAGGKARGLGHAARSVSNMMTIARTEAITQRTVTRLVIASDWSGDKEANFRKLSIWRQDPAAAGGWRQISPWEELPDGIAFEPTCPTYASNVNSSYLLDGELNLFTTTFGEEAVSAKFVEFLPTGAARMPQTTGPEICLALASGQIDNGAMTHTGLTSAGSPTNWATVSANTLTGRLKIAQP